VSAIRKRGAMMTEKTLRVPGMHCHHCKAAVENELSKISGVASSNADVEKGTVEVSYDEGTVTTEDLEEAIEEAGYTVAA
jgi:copper chaperone